MTKILVSGGPVHAYLDAVKLITNRFKGGLMAKLASDLVLKGSTLDDDVYVTYLCTKDSKLPGPPPLLFESGRIKVVYHDGFEDYRDKVLELAPEMDAVILGAAVANLIPLNPLKGKFPSHNYKVGDKIPIDFTIAPRIINMVKKVAPQTTLFGFKLLSGVEHEELIRAAYEIVLDSGATGVIANDATDLQSKYVVTKERGVHPVQMKDLSEYLWPFIRDEYYHTTVHDPEWVVRNTDAEEEYQANRQFKLLKQKYEEKFQPIPEGYLFGTIAIRPYCGSGFWTTLRGKKELEKIDKVTSVDHFKKEIRANAKVTLNAPLLDMIFKSNHNVHAIVHYHKQEGGLLVFDYAPPGTVRDSMRDPILLRRSFNIKEHGCFLLFDRDMKQI